MSTEIAVGSLRGRGGGGSEGERCLGGGEGMGTSEAWAPPARLTISASCLAKPGDPGLRQSGNNCLAFSLVVPFSCWAGHGVSIWGLGKKWGKKSFPD